MFVPLHVLLRAHEEIHGDLCAAGRAEARPVPRGVERHVRGAEEVCRQRRTRSRPRRTQGLLLQLVIG